MMSFVFKHGNCSCYRVVFVKGHAHKKRCLGAPSYTNEMCLEWHLGLPNWSRVCPWAMVIVHLLPQAWVV